MTIQRFTSEMRFFHLYFVLTYIYIYFIELLCELHPSSTTASLINTSQYDLNSIDLTIP